ncbi:hypothetical protein RyT2_13300 [Pseudolactococcus yaeyamensis]
MDIEIEIPKIFGDKKYISEFYCLSEKTISNLISKMRSDKQYRSGSCFRLSGRVWLPAFDAFLQKEKNERFK